MFRHRPVLSGRLSLKRTLAELEDEGLTNEASELSAACFEAVMAARRSMLRARAQAFKRKLASMYSKPRFYCSLDRRGWKEYRPSFHQDKVHLRIVIWTYDVRPSDPCAARVLTSWLGDHCYHQLEESPFYLPPPSWTDVNIYPDLVTLHLVLLAGRTGVSDILWAQARSSYAPTLGLFFEDDY